MIGCLPTYSENTYINLYLEIADQLFLANEIEDAVRKRAIFLSSVGTDTYKKIRDLCLPNLPNTKTYEEIATLLRDHLSPAPAESVQRYKFHNCTRKDGESVAAYTSRLRALAEHCNFGANLEASLRDRLVCGISNESIQKRLLSETELTFRRAYELAVGLEAASKNSDFIKSSCDSTQVNKIHTRSSVKFRNFKQQRPVQMPPLWRK